MLKNPGIKKWNGKTKEEFCKEKFGKKAQTCDDYKRFYQIFHKYPRLLKNDLTYTELIHNADKLESFLNNIDKAGSKFCGKVVREHWRRDYLMSLD